MEFREASKNMLEGYGTFFNELKNTSELNDILLIFVIPVVLTTVFLIPEPIQQSLMLNFQDVSVFNLFSYAFVHQGYNHFTGNLINYVFLAYIIYFLCALCGEKRLYRISWFAFVLFLPVVTALVEIAVSTPFESLAGFSGVDSALIGFLPVSVVLFLRNRVSKQIEITHALVPFLLILSIVSVLFSGVSAFTLVALTATVSLIIVYLRESGADTFRDVFSDLSSMPGCFELVLIAASIFLLSPIAIFPEDILRSSGAVDIFAHYLGLISGFLLPYIYLVYRDADSDRMLEMIKK